MMIEFKNIRITSKHIMIVVSTISIISTILLAYFKLFNNQDNTDLTMLIFSLLISVSSLYLINK
ncbi:hypothetical protein C3495_13910 (plasmid) [Clostridiaceae bacterium 14S0207]|nr:hypothetical protein C3495_13910 [Clostridiaceae bacterium 14S0207]